MSKNPAVPVIMYHSIGIPNKNWQWNFLTCPYKLFQSQLKWIKKKKFQTISLQQLYDYMKEGSISENSIVLTFDDGYVDNWIFAYPLLKKYGFKGTIYVSPEFVDARNVVRTNLEDIWNGEATIDELEAIGYLSWRELKAMEDEGVMDIQSHTMSHTFYPMSDRIIDFRHPGDPYTWITWNANPAKKPCLQIDNDTLVNYGEPVYEYGRAIGIRRYLDDDNFKELMIDYVEKKGGIDFFRFKNWRDELFEVATKHKEENRINERYETEEEYEERVYYELQKSKEIIEDRLDKEVKFLCWPGGAVTDKALKIASDLGYLSSTVGKDMEYEKRILRNKYLEDPFRINRIGAVLYWDGVEGFESTIKYMNGFFFVLLLYTFGGGKITALPSRLILALASRMCKLRDMQALV